MSLTNPDHSLDGESRSELIMGLAVTFTAINTAAVSARIYTRAVLLRQLGIDDYFIGITQVLAIGLNITTFLEGYYGVGKHSWVSTPDDATRQLECLFSSIQLYIWALCLVKISLLLQYRRIFTVVWLQRLSLALIAFAVCWNISQSILVSFACIPMSLLVPSLAENCLEPLAIWYIAAGFNIVTDFIVCLMPIPLINSLQLPLKQKLLLCGVFALGFIACSISIGRVPTLYLVVNADDPSWYGSDAALLSMTEVNTAILCSCLPPIRFLLARIFPFLGSSRLDVTSRSNKKYSPGSRGGVSGSAAAKQPTTHLSSATARRVSRLSAAFGGGTGNKKSQQQVTEIDLGEIKGSSSLHSETAMEAKKNKTTNGASGSSRRSGGGRPVLGSGVWGFDFDKDDDDEDEDCDTIVTGGSCSAGEKHHHQMRHQQSAASVSASNFISAWVSGSSGTTAEARRVSMEESSSERRLVLSNQEELGQQIIVTRETVVQVQREDMIDAAGGGAGAGAPGRAM